MNGRPCRTDNRQAAYPPDWSPRLRESDWFMNSDLQISLKNGTPAEARMREILTSLPREYNLAGWILTNVIEIDGGGWPHSHPVLTLNTAFEQDVTDRKSIRLNSSHLVIS